MATGDVDVDVETSDLDAVISGLDNLEVMLPPEPSQAAKIWAATWPKLSAVAVAVIGWQLIVWSHWKPDYILPGPWAVGKAFWHGIVDGNLHQAEQGPIAPLGDELGVDAEPPTRAGKRRGISDVSGAGQCQWAARDGVTPCPRLVPMPPDATARGRRGDQARRADNRPPW